MPREIVIPLLQQERDPADLALGQQQLEVRVPFEIAVEDKVEQRVGGIVGLNVGRFPDTLDAPRVAVLDIAVPGQDMADHRHVRLGAGGNERVVMLDIAERQRRVRHLPDQGAAHAHILGAVHLLDRAIDVVHRNQRHADQAPMIGRAPVMQPVIIELEGFLLQLDIVDAVKRHAVVGEDDLRRDAVIGLVLQPQIGVERAGRRIAEGHLGQFLEQARRQLLPQLVRLHHVRVGRYHLRHDGQFFRRQLLADQRTPRKGRRLLRRHAGELRCING